MTKRNCWEVKNCGRGVGGEKVAELGTCSASTASGYHGYNGGLNGGRYCWRISGTMCGGEVQGSFARKIGNCLGCEFFRLVRTEEGAAARL